MRRSALLVLAWLAGGLLAVALASAAVGRVGNQVTGDRPAPLSAADVRDELAAEATASTTATTAPVPAPGEAPATTSSTAPPVTTAEPTTAPTVAPPEETRTYPLIGGTATIRFSPAGVSVVAANPNPGFSVEVEPHDGGVEVSFRGESHRSEVQAWWSGGPQDTVDEESESEDD